VSFPSVAELIPVLQVAIGPVILISGVGLLLLSMTNRLGRAIDRARQIHELLAASAAPDHSRYREELRILQKRAHLLRRAIILASVSILLAALLIMTLFLAAVLGWNVGWLILLLFMGCMGALIGSMLAFVQDVNQSLAALQLELDEPRMRDRDTCGA
jgi:hypothetical protein